MAQKKLTRAEIQAGLDQFPIESLLSSGAGKNPQLSAKAKAFAKAVALGDTKAAAYRKSYKQDATPSTIAAEPYKLASDPRVAKEIAAYKLAIHASEHRTAGQLKALLVQQLVQHSLDEDFPPAQRVQCLKLIGTLFEVNAFNESKTTTVIHQSQDLRARLLATLRDVSDVEIKDDGLDLLAEIQGVGIEKGADSAPTTPPPAQSGMAEPDDSTHTVSDKQPSTKSGGTPHRFGPDEVVVDFDK